MMMRPEGHAVHDRRGEAGIGERGPPFAERVVAGHRDRGPFLAFGQDLEQQFGAAGVDADIAELVDDEQVQAGVTADHFGAPVPDRGDTQRALRAQPQRGRPTPLRPVRADLALRSRRCRPGAEQHLRQLPARARSHVPQDGHRKNG